MHVSSKRSFVSNYMVKTIAHIRYIKIQLDTIDITTRLYGVNHTNPYNIPQKPCSDVYYFKLNFNISKMGYCACLSQQRSVTALKPCEFSHLSLKHD